MFHNAFVFWMRYLLIIFLLVFLIIECNNVSLNKKSTEILYSDDNLENIKQIYIKKRDILNCDLPNDDDSEKEPDTDDDCQHKGIEPQFLAEPIDSDLPEPGPEIKILHTNLTPDFIVHPFNNTEMNATVSFTRLVEKNLNGSVKVVDIPQSSTEYIINESSQKTTWTTNSNCDGCTLAIEFSMIKNETLIPLLNSDKVFRVNKNSYKWSFIIQSWPFNELDNEFEIEMQLNVSSPVITTETKNYKDSGEEITRITLRTLYFEVRLSLPHLAVVDDSVVLYVVPELIKISQDVFVIKATLPYFENKILYDPDITVIQTAEVKPIKEQPGFVLEAWHIVVIVIAIFIFVVGIIVTAMYLKKRKELKEAEKRWKSAADV